MAVRQGMGQERNRKASFPKPDRTGQANHAAANHCNRWSNLNHRSTLQLLDLTTDFTDFTEKNLKICEICEICG